MSNSSLFLLVQQSLTNNKEKNRVFKIICIHSKICFNIPKNGFLYEK